MKRFDLGKRLLLTPGQLIEHTIVGTLLYLGASLSGSVCVRFALPETYMLVGQLCYLSLLVSFDYLLSEWFVRRLFRKLTNEEKFFLNRITGLGIFPARLKFTDGGNVVAGLEKKGLIQQWGTQGDPSDPFSSTIEWMIERWVLEYIKKHRRLLLVTGT